MNPAHESNARPPWYQAIIWTGADFNGLLRILNENREQLTLSNLPGCAVDLCFAMGNTSLRGMQHLIYGPRLKRVELHAEPVFVIGHWRTGTTLIHELLALDNRHSFPTTYQCFAPNHFVLSERFLKPWTEFTLPKTRPPDKMAMGWDRPQEDEFALCNRGVPSPYATIAFPNRPPQNLDYLELEALSPIERERWERGFIGFLKQVQFRRPGRLILKSPTHTFRVPTLLELFPGARFLHMVRDPTTVFMSSVRLWTTLGKTHGYQPPDRQSVEEFVYDTFERMHERLEATRHLIPQKQFVEIRYEELVADMCSTMQGVYQQLGLGSFDAVQPAIADFAARHATYRTNEYTISEETRAEVVRRWRPYYQKYGYPT